MDGTQIWKTWESDKKAFLDDLRPKYIMPSLLKYKVITENENNDVLKEESPEKQVVKLFATLQNKSPQLFKYFIKALRVDLDGCETYPWLASKLEKSPILSKEAYSVLVNGNIPFPVNYLLQRDKKIDEVRDKLKWLSDQNPLRNWVVLFGPIGSGKSVLAAESLRDNDLIEKCFPGGIYWIQIGHPKDDDALWIKMNRLLRLMNLNDNVPPSDSVQDLNFILKREVCQKPKMLLVLDDVWYDEAIKAFDIGCPILVTTKNRKSLDKVNSYCEFINCNDDLSYEEIKILLAMYAKCQVSELPMVVENVCQKCKGSPLIASLIGGKMADFGCNEKAWKDLDDRLNKSGLGTLRKRYASGDSKEELSKIVNLCFEPIKDYKDYYLDFIIFVTDIPVPNEVFEILWEKEEYEVYEIMFELYKRCFVQMEKSEENELCCTYTSHELYLETLKAEIEDEKAEKVIRHKKLVTQILKKNEGKIDLMRLPKGYIPYTIGHHLFHAGEYEILRNLYLDLHFVEQKIQLTGGVMDILYDYSQYKQCFRDEDEVDKLVSFLQRNSNALTLNKSDIIQLALFEPSTSNVYKSAWEVATKSDRKVYYDWCNGNEIVERIPYLFNDFESCEVTKGKYAMINRDASRVAAFADEKLGLEIRSINGELLQELSGHSDSINYCSFNSAGDRLITASEDTTIKIFKVVESLTSSGSYYSGKRSSKPEINLTSDKRDNSLLTFRDHEDPVLCCSFSTNDQFIISCDIGVTYVWQVNGKKWIIEHRKQHPNPKVEFNFCCISNKGKMFAASANDTVQVWDFVTGSEKWTLYHDGFLVNSFCFSSNDTYLLSITDNFINKWDLENGEKIESISTGNKRNYVLCSICISESYIACGTSKGSVIVINKESKVVVANLRGHSQDVGYVMFSKDGRKLFSCSSKKIVAHDINGLKDLPLVSYEGNLCASEDKNLLVATSNYFDCLEIRSGLEGTLLSCSKPEESEISACSLSNDCSVVVYGTKTGNIKVYKIATKQTIELVPKHVGQVNYILHSKHDSVFFTCSEDKTVRIWKDGSDPLKLKGHTQSVLMCTEFKRSEKLLSCSKDGSLRIWNSETGELILPITEGHGNQDVRFCDISPREDRLASASADETIKVWNACNGELLQCFQLYDPNSSVRCCRFSPSSEILISGHDNGKLVLWHLHGRQGPNILSVHDSVVYDIQFTQDGSAQFLSLSKAIKLWSRSAQPLQTILLPSSYMGSDSPCLWASRDFKTLVVVLNSILYILKRIELDDQLNCDMQHLSVER